MKPERKMIVEDVKNQVGFDIDNFDARSIDEVIEYLLNIRSKIAELGYENAKFVLEYGYDDVYWSLNIERLETDTEYQKRIKEEEAEQIKHAKRAKEQREKDLKELERLMKKYKAKT